jgi:hypothetical protein
VASKVQLVGILNKKRQRFIFNSGDELVIDDSEFAMNLKFNVL